MGGVAKIPADAGGQAEIGWQEVKGKNRQGHPWN